MFESAPLQLPGAFSAYRWVAIQGAPLAAYFKLEDKDAVKTLRASTANMYLGACPVRQAPWSRECTPFASVFAAEDRILGFEIVAKADGRWRLHYDAAAQASTDVPDSVGKLVKQRRRWLNGSFFATLYSLWNWGRMMRGNKHSLAQRALFFVLFLWNVLNVVLAWCANWAMLVAITSTHSSPLILLHSSSTGFPSAMPTLSSSWCSTQRVGLPTRIPRMVRTLSS